LEATTTMLGDGPAMVHGALQYVEEKMMSRQGHNRPQQATATTCHNNHTHKEEWCHNNTSEGTDVFGENFNTK
jgi:hypothetical protein